MGNRFGYYINLDERGDFYADVRNEAGSTVFEIEGGEIFEDGFMRDKRDIPGLEEHLIGLGILAPGDTLMASGEFEQWLDAGQDGDAGEEGAEWLHEPEDEDGPGPGIAP